MKFKKLMSVKMCVSSIGAAMLLNGCTLHTEVPQIADSDVPQQWLVAQDAQNQWPEQEWWNGFANAELTQLIATIQQQNLDLAINQRNLEAAQITLRDAGFDLWPTFNLGVGTGANYTESRIDGNQTSSSPNSPFEAGVSVNYGNLMSKPAVYTQEVANYDSREALVADVHLKTLGTSASSYFQLLLIRDKIRAAELNVENAALIYEIANARVENGVAVPIEALQQQIALQQQQANLSSLRQNELAALATLALLTGTGVQNFSLTGETLDDVAVPDIVTGLPSELLLRRPDLVQAEAELRSSTAALDIVRSAYFPDINLTSSLSSGTTALSQLLASPDTFLTMNAALVQTLLDNGQRGRNVDRARLTLENSLAEYRIAVIDAFNEIDVLLNAMDVQEELLQVALQNLATAEESYRIAQARYEEGLIDFQTVLTSQNTLFSSRNNYLDSKLAQLNTTVNLFEALGGGWQAQ